MSSHYEVECGDCGTESEAQVTEQGAVKIGIELPCGHNPVNRVIVLYRDDPYYRVPIGEVSSSAPPQSH